MNKSDVQDFFLFAEREILALHQKLRNGSYRHGGYVSFTLCDPKRRVIHKAKVEDRLLHHAVHRVLAPLFEKRFLYDSFSSRKYKGVHKARSRFRKFAWKCSQNITKTVWVLQCDVRKFFDNIDHEILMRELKKNVPCEKTLKLLRDIIQSFSGERGTACPSDLSAIAFLPAVALAKEGATVEAERRRRGIPLGNLTSQLFSNAYLHPFDEFVKRHLRIKYYVRYADDFAIVSRDKKYLEDLVSVLQTFLRDELKLHLHPKKITIKKWHSGVDFLGAVSFPYHSVLRTKTKKRMFRMLEKHSVSFEDGNLEKEKFQAVIASYLGIASHVNGWKLRNKMQKYIDVCQKKK